MVSSSATRSGGGVVGRAGGLDAAILFVTGFSVAVGGLLLAAAPNLSWQLTKVFVRLGELGLNTGSLFMGGMTLVGLGMLSRTLSQMAEGQNDDSDAQLLLEQLATDMAQTRSSLSRLDRRVAGLTKAVQEKGPEPAAEPAAAGAEDQESADALWRLAASLDQLGARIERGLEDQVQGLAAQLDELREAASAVEAAVEPVADDAAPVEADAAPAPAPVASEEAPAEAHDEAADAEEEESDADVLSELDDIDFLSDEDGAEDEPAAAEAASAIDLDPVDLGEMDLDDLDDGPAAPLPANAPESKAPVDLDGLLPDDRIRASLDRARDPD